MTKYLPSVYTILCTMDFFFVFTRCTNLAFQNQEHIGFLIFKGQACESSLPNRGEPGLPFQAIKCLSLIFFAHHLFFLFNYFVC